MTVYLNDTTIELPSTLAEITLGERIGFHNTYGKELEALYKEIEKETDEFDKEQARVNFNYAKMMRVFSFVSGVPVESLEESPFLDVISTVYFSRLENLFSDQFELETRSEFVFKEISWELSEPELRNGSRMTFGEFIDAKQMVKSLSDDGVGKWEIVKHLACIYLRKTGEPYKEEFLYEDSERLELFDELPMDIAAQVDFFLSGIMNFSMPTSRYSERQEQSRRERMLSDTMICTAG